MKKRVLTTNHRLTIISLLYVLFAFFMLMVFTYAWFTLTDINKASLIKNVSGVEAEYQYFVYNDQTHSGSLEQTLINNVALTAGEDLSYELVPNPTVAQVIDGFIAPGERFSFAIKITNIGTGIGYLSLSFGQVYSNGYDLEVNRIQNAMYYEVTKIVYTYNGQESLDIKDNAPVSLYSSYFDQEPFHVYDMLKNVPLGYTSTDSVVIIFFDIIFDPTIYGQDINGIPYTNSNIFMGQTIAIYHIYMNLSPNQEVI